MISFRYHLVSIIAVFLALALGIVVGTTGLNGAILSDLRSNVKSQKSEIAKLRAENSTLQKQSDNADDFASAYSKQVLKGSLTDQAVVIVSAPGADSKIKSGVEKAILAGGGTIAGKIQLSTDFVDPARGSDIIGLATGSAHPDGWNAPVTSDSATIGGALLGYVLSGSGTPQDISTVLSGFATLHMLSVDGGDPKGADLAVVIGSGTAQKTDPKIKAMPSLVTEFNKYSLKTVVAGDAGSATEAGLIALVRSDSILPRAVSTVDNADSGLGQVSAVLALAGLVGGTTGQYGTGTGATALFPSASSTSK